MTARESPDRAALVDAGCPLCGPAAASVSAFDEGGWVVRRCLACRTLFVSPRPDAAAVRDLYGHDHAQLAAGVHLRASPAQRLHARHVAGLLARHATGGRLVEIGAGGGQFVAEARRRGFVVEAVELNPAQAAHVRDVLGIPCDERPFEAARWSERPLDVVVHLDVLSHFPDTLAALREQRAALRPGGLLLLETGNLADVRDDVVRSLPSLQLPDHLAFFGEASLRALLDAAGFDVVAWHAYAIGLEIRARRAVVALPAWWRRIASRRPRPAAGDAVAAVPAVAPRPAPSAARLRVWGALDHVFHALRYGAGRLLARPGEPMTIVVIARRRG